jgi:hypothetical protein
MTTEPSAISDARAIEHDGAIADQRLIVDGATVQQHQMADRAVAADVQRLPGIRVQHATILYIAARADLDELIVGTHHAVEPQARRGTESHRADDLRARSDVIVLPGSHQLSLPQAVHGHGTPPPPSWA